jgi:two-component system NarL family sensor kinase
MSQSPGSEILERQNRELGILNSIATSLNESVDLPASLGVALSRVAELLDLRTGWVWLLDEETGESYLAAAQDLPPGLAAPPERMEGSCYCLDAFRGGGLKGAANVVTCSRLKWLAEGTGGLRYHASIPLHARGKQLGVMNVASAEWRRLSPSELGLLHTIGDMLGIAIERARLFARSAEIGAAEERNRLAREIHDTLAQGLSATALHLDTAEALIEAGAPPERVKTAVHRALETTRENLEDARRSVLDLRGAPLEGRTLANALEGLCASFSTDETEVRFRSVAGARPLPQRVEAGLYRVAQEALSNALRHASARTVSVSLVTEPDRVTLSIEDDGRGFVIGEAKAGRFGLIGMRERIRLLDGTFRLESENGQGTRVEATVGLMPDAAGGA